MYSENKKILGLPKPVFVSIAIKVIVILIIFSVLFVTFVEYQDSKAEDRMSYYTSDYQAVFLVSGQVYFGNIYDRTETDVYLEDVYYLQVDSAEQALNLENGADVSILRLYNELHGPEDSIEINRSEVRYVENLREDSEIVQAINNFKQGQN